MSYGQNRWNLSFSDLNKGRIICPFVSVFSDSCTENEAHACGTVRTYYYSQGTEIYCAPTVDARPSWQHSMRHIALEGRCFVLSACQYSTEKDYPQDHTVEPSSRAEENVMIAGGSVIVNPLGEVLAGPLLGQEGILMADLDLNDIVRGKFDLDVVGHYARPDSEWHCLVL